MTAVGVGGAARTIVEVDRPKSAEKLLLKFLNQPASHNGCFKDVTDAEGNLLESVWYVDAWNACDNYFEGWLSPTWYWLSMTDPSGDTYEGAWSKAWGSWRFQHANDHWGNEQMTLTWLPTMVVPPKETDDDE